MVVAERDVTRVAVGAWALVSPRHTCSDSTDSLNRNSIMLTLKPTALPSDAAEHHHLGQDASRAYNICRYFEERAMVDNNVLDVMHARILGYLIIHSPSLTAQGEVVKLIHSCNNNHAILSVLASTFLDYYIRPCEQHGAQTLRLRASHAGH